MHCYKLIIAYDGTNYSGWQIQPNAPSIQQHLQEALCCILRNEHITVIGSGRTDAGVHAAGQVAHFHWQEELDFRRVLLSLNGLLPRDIRVKSIEIAPPSFHAQYDAIGKEYHYHIHLDPVMNPFQRLYAWHCHAHVDIALLEEAATHFVGKHDFTAFANEAHRGSAAKDPVRDLYRLDIVRIEGGLRLEFEGDGFLYKMVRNIVGTLIQVSSGQRSLDDIAAIFASKDRKQAAMAAPPQGLFLVRVDY